MTHGEMKGTRHRSDSGNKPALSHFMMVEAGPSRRLLSPRRAHRKVRPASYQKSHNKKVGKDQTEAYRLGE